MYFKPFVKKCEELAFQFAIKNKLPVPESWETNRKAEKQRWKSLKDKHNLPIRKPKLTSTGHATAFNQHKVKEYFNNLGTAIARYQFTSDRIFNLMKLE